MSLMDKDNFINPNIPYLVNTPILEYDLKSAGYNILKNQGVFSEYEEYLLENMDKKSRNVYIGTMIQMDDTKQIRGLIQDGLKYARNKFYELNQLQPEHILSIKRDAIFVHSMYCNILEFEGFQFSQKTKYVSYYKLGRLELYYSSRKNILDVKGISDENLVKHEGTIDFLKSLFNLHLKGNKISLFKFLKKYREDYLNRKLDISHYREFNSNSMYRLESSSMLIGDVYLDESNDISKIDIRYNYLNVIVPLIKYFL